MAVYEKAKILFSLKGAKVKLSGDRYEGIASVQIVECSPAISMLLVIPAIPEGIVDMISITDQAQLKSDQTTCAVEIALTRTGAVVHEPVFTVTVQLQEPIVFWEFMAIYTTAMLKYGNHQVAIDDLLTEIINDEESELKDEDESEESEADDPDHFEAINDSA
ncbi:hypothetical protein L227DRAFT_617142 [Lentinus tigrinus ALCF2SS1-6]|uniref:Uncharacterized protein n=2 Tax=Lentinus tigrinus TaxID=5365 RepID=A0A5C2RPZ4_9APHY|nr:hypothetical protein L227DRAFT_617142 [Lentinus tigrinus ALCF2SS1-6]